MTDKVAKSTKKSGPRTAHDADKQRERKRALDRKAQRTSREKTKSHIAHLENMVRILGGNNNGGSSTSELMEEITRLNAEVDRLRKIIESIKSLLGVEMLEDVAKPRTQHQSPARESSGSQSPRVEGSRIGAITSSSGDSPPFNGPEEMNWSIQPTIETNDTLGGMTVYTGILGSPVKADTNDYADTIDQSSVSLSNHWDGLQVGNYASHQQLWELPSPNKTRLPPPIPEYSPCQIWQKANSIYARIFQFDKQFVYDTDKAHSGALVKAVRHGWNSLNIQEKSNPVLQILKEVDSHLFNNLDPITKVANLYKSFLVLKYHFNSKPYNLETMPPWQRPLHCQKTRRHPIPIDFFPWPHLRERLMSHHNYYFASSDFCSQYRNHFRFNFPFGFDQTYTFDPLTGNYTLSPLFEMYHQDIKSWSMEKVFFEKFPELLGEMTVFEDIKPSSQHFNMGNGSKETSHANVLELFDEYPPT